MCYFFSGIGCVPHIVLVFLRTEGLTYFIFRLWKILHSSAFFNGNLNRNCKGFNALSTKTQFTNQPFRKCKLCYSIILNVLRNPKPIADSFKPIKALIQRKLHSFQTQICKNIFRSIYWSWTTHTGTGPVILIVFRNSFWLIILSRLVQVSEYFSN